MIIINFIVLCDIQNVNFNLQNNSPQDLKQNGGNYIMGRKRKTTTLGIENKNQIKNTYGEIFGKVAHAVGINLYTEIGDSDYVIIKDGANEVVRLDGEDYDYGEIIREIKKQFIKNNLFLVEMIVEQDALVIHTTTDLLSLLYMPYFDEENYSANELQEIKDEIEKENGGN